MAKIKLTTIWNKVKSYWNKTQEIRQRILEFMAGNTGPPPNTDPPSRANKFTTWLIALVILLFLWFLLTHLWQDFRRLWPFGILQILVILILFFELWRCYLRRDAINKSIVPTMKKAWEKICGLLVIFITLCFGYFVIFNWVIKALLETKKSWNKDFYWILFLSVALFILWLLILFFKKKLMGEEPDEQRPKRQAAEAQTKEGKAWETIAEISLAVGTVILAFITMEHSAATKNIAKEIEKARKYDMKPRLTVFDSRYRYNSGTNDLSFTLTNIGKGIAYDLSIGLEYECENSQKEPLRWGITFVRDTTFYISKSTIETVYVNLKNDSEGSRDVDMEDLITLLSNPVTQPSFKAFIVYKDIEEAQYLTFIRLIPEKIKAPIEFPKDFFKNIRKGEYERKGYFPKYYDDVEIYP